MDQKKRIINNIKDLESLLKQQLYKEPFFLEIKKKKDNESQFELSEQVKMLFTKENSNQY
mgnify:CR=1 FL=1